MAVIAKDNALRKKQTLKPLKSKRVNTKSKPTKEEAPEQITIAEAVEKRLIIPHKVMCDEGLIDVGYISTYDMMCSDTVNVFIPYQNDIEEMKRILSKGGNTRKYIIHLI